MIKIAEKKLCSGCAACAQICPNQCIVMLPDEEGFLYPHVTNLEQCLKCELCLKICPIKKNNGQNNDVMYSFAGYAKDEYLRINSSSGGLFGVFAQLILSQGGVVFGAAFDEKQMVRHIAIENYEELSKLQGSKYVQSEIKNTYIEAKDELDNGRKVLFSGTECQIAGLKSFLRKEYDNLFTIDVLCHGVPSPKVWKRYLDEQKRINGSDVKRTFFRKKDFGWKMYALELQFDNLRAYTKVYHKDDFMQMFLQNICLRPSCHSCKFKDLNRSSDLTLGDAWGCDKVMPDMDDDKGTSIILIHSEKGRMLFESVKYQIVVKPGEVDVLLPLSSDSRKSVTEHPNRKKFFWLIKKNAKWNRIVHAKDITFIDKCRIKIKNLVSKLCMGIFK